MKHIKVLLVIFFLSYKIFAQSPELDQLNEASFPINSFTNADGYEDLMPIIPMLADIEVVGIGEATHGTKEFFQLKQKVSEVLIQKLGFKVLIIETYFADTEEMNHYALTGEGNP